MNHLARVRRLCLSLPEATEKEAWGAPTFRVRNRMFAMFADDHHGDGRIALWCSALPGAQKMLVDSDPERFFVPPYVGPKGWVGLHLDRSNDGLVLDTVKRAYCAVAPSALRERMQGDEKKTGRPRQRRADGSGSKRRGLRAP
jgi:hypothetical protein